MSWSHPVWVRGLKPASHKPTMFDMRSHPVWVRGLKLLLRPMTLNCLMSHPVWVRGLKHHLLVLCLAQSGRTPCGCVD